MGAFSWAWYTFQVGSIPGPHCEVRMRNYTSGQTLFAEILGIDLAAHDLKVETAKPPIGSWVKQITNRRENQCGHTEDEHARLQLIADEAALTMADDPFITSLDTEFRLQQLEADFVSIEGRPVGRPRHKNFPVYTPSRLV